MRSLPRPLALLLVPLLALVASQDSAPIPLAQHENPALLDFEVRSRDGLALAARLTFVPKERSARGLFANVAAAPRELAVRDGVLYSRTGKGKITVPPGRYTLYASHGPEWSIASRELALAAGETSTFRVELEHEIETPGWASGDFHLHTLTHSGHGDANLEERVLSLLGEGLDFAVATDHNHNTDYRPTMRSLGVEGAFVAVTGNEVSTPIGHFNAFPLDPRAAPIDSSLEDANALFALLRAERAADGSAPVIQLNHPRMEGIDYFGHAGLDPVTGRSTAPSYSRDFDAIEVLNENRALGYHDPVLDAVETPGHAHSVLRDWFHLLDLGERYAATGNSDSHHVRDVVAGYPRNYVRCPEDTDLTPALIAEAVRAKQLFTTTGPFLEIDLAGAGMGGSARAEEGHALLSVRVRAASWIDCDRVRVFANGAEVATLPIAENRAALRLEQEIELCFLDACARHGDAGHGASNASGRARDAWVVVVVEGDEAPLPILGEHCRPLAIANPVWVDGDADGRWTSPDERIAAELDAQPTPDVARAWFKALRPGEQALALAHIQRGPFAAVLLESAFDLPEREVLLAAARAAARTRTGANLRGVQKAWNDNTEDPFLGALLLEVQLGAHPETGAAGLSAYVERFGEEALRRHAAELLPLLGGDPQMHWRLLGPLPADPALLQRPGPPAAASQAHGAGPDWSTLPPRSALRYVDLVGLGGADTEHTIVYAQTFLHAKQASELLCAFGSDDGSRVWLEGELVYENRSLKAAHPLEKLLSLKLRPGWNRVVLEVENATGGFGFHFRPLSDEVESAPTPAPK